jgi:hypothetical protein
MTDTEQAQAEVATVTENLPEFRALYDPDLDFRKLALEATYYAKGFRLVNKDWLTGLTFVCVNAIYRPGFMKDSIQGDYVSLESVVADRDTINLPQVRQSYAEAHGGAVDLFVFPNEPIVINDGSTGVRRTITKHLHDVGMIDVGGKESDGLARFDRPFTLWKSGADEAQVGFASYPDGKPFRYLAPRGLRRSEYEYQGMPATTFYFG